MPLSVVEPATETDPSLIVSPEAAVIVKAAFGSLGLVLMRIRCWPTVVAAGSFTFVALSVMKYMRLAPEIVPLVAIAVVLVFPNV